MNLIGSLFGRKKDSLDANSALVRAMQEVASHDNPESRKTLYDALLGSMLLVPVPEIPAGLAPGLQTAGNEVQIRLTAVMDRNQIKITAAFTDVDALRNWDPNIPYMGLKARDLFRVIMGTDIQELAINPFDPIRKMIRPGGRVKRNEMELLSRGVVPEFSGPKVEQYGLKANQKVFIGTPAKPPSAEVEELLKDQAASFASIAELYVFQMATESGPSNTVIGITLNEDVPRTRQEEIVWAMSTSVRPKLESNQTLDFLFLRGPMRDQIRTLGTLIFRKP
jgi:SseB protein N-terminal domain/SseB protein C-terminal domain